MKLSGIRVGPPMRLNDTGRINSLMDPDGDVKLHGVYFNGHKVEIEFIDADAQEKGGYNHTQVLTIERDKRTALGPGLVIYWQSGRPHISR